jgi:hypothetical protein
MRISKEKLFRQAFQNELLELKLPNNAIPPSCRAMICIAGTEYKIIALACKI